MDYHVSVGDQVEAGDSIASVETDKATMEFEVQDEGYIAWINTEKIGELTKLGQPCAILVESIDEIAHFKNFSPDAPSKPKAAPAPQAPQESASPQPQAQPQTTEDVKISTKIFISPRALKTFLDKGHTKESLVSNLEALSAKQPILGSGPGGRIIEQDVDSLLKKMTEKKEAPVHLESAKPRAPPVEVPGEYKEVELSTMRRVIAERLSQSKREIPHYYLEAEIRMDALLEMKKELQEKAGVKLSVNDFIVKAVAKASKEVPDCNTNFVDNKIRFFENVDVR